MELDEERQGFFRPFSQGVFRGLRADQWASFCSLSSDEQRIGFVYDLPEVRQVALAEVFKEKDEAEAKKKKDEGNAAFLAGDYPAAMRCYSRAMAVAPFKEDGTSELVAVCAANRSACLFHAGRHARCLADVELALQSGYPVALRFKVLDRRARSLMALKRFSEAKTAFQSVIKALDDANLEAGKHLHWQKEIQKMLVLFDTAKYTDAPAKPQSWLPPLPPLTSGANPDYPSASKKVAFSSTSTEGRFAVSSQPVAVGDVLVVERPFAAVLRPEKHGTHCIHCQTRIRDCVPCTGCAGVLFCSLSCRTAALDTYHRFECRILDLLYASGMSVTCMLSLRLVSRLRLQQLLEARPRLDRPAERYDPDDYGNIHRLVSHAEGRTAEAVFPLALMAAFMLRCLEFQNYFGPEVDTTSLDDTRRYVGALLLHHIQLVPYNAHEVAELQMKGFNNIDDSQSQFLGAAVYPTLALFNHSCDPGIVRYFSGTTVIVRAIKNISKGEMIAENYGPIFTQKTLRERLQYLRERYEFECKCKPCTELWPTFAEMDNSMWKFKCQTCKSALPVSTETLSPLFTCSSCGHETNIMKALKVLQDTEATFKAGMRDLETGDLNRGMEKLKDNLTRLDECLYPPFRDYHLCQQAVRKVMLTLGNKYVAERKA
ncbi:SET and MYND domain-containing protein 4-like [Pollicipes pollicipes]|uniref:SET and MYND domain-containing protein 4-like n=1 Tax=Pollicipes pollicipes TaxID=41117 RepID=UPI0018853B23|nr:SET and MYND domain-containing protein 4-like [Pollicipes pollicipes]